MFDFIVKLGLGNWQTILIVQIIISWIIFSLKIVKPGEIGVLVFLGWPICFYNSGLKFAPFFFGSYLQRFPRKWFELDFSAMGFILEGINGAEAILEVDAVLYIRLPPDKRLKEVLRAGIPTTRDEMIAFFEGQVREALALTLEKKPWREVIRDLETVRDEAVKILAGPNSILSRAGFQAEHWQLGIKQIRLPGLEEVLSQPDKERLRRNGAGSASQAAVMETGLVLAKSLREIRAQSKKDFGIAVQGDPKLQNAFLRNVTSLLKLRMRLDSERLQSAKKQRRERVKASAVEDPEGFFT